MSSLSLFSSIDQDIADGLDGTEKAKCDGESNDPSTKCLVSLALSFVNFEITGRGQEIGDNYRHAWRQYLPSDWHNGVVKCQELGRHHDNKNTAIVCIGIQVEFTPCIFLNGWQQVGRFVVQDQSIMIELLLT